VALQVAPALSVTVTVPVGVPANAAATLTLTVTACPTEEGLGEEVSAVVVFAFPTMIEPLAGDVLPL
jgi:predicted small secreted protein